MRRKAFLTIILMLTALFTISLANLKFQIDLPLAYSQLPNDYPMVFVNPDVIVASVNETFTVDVKVYNLTEDAEVEDPSVPFRFVSLGNLYAFDIQFSWDPNVLEYVNHTLKIPVEKYSDGVLHEPIFDPLTIDEVNEDGVPKAEPGTLYWCSASSQAPAEPFNCEGKNATFFTMTFKVKAEGTCNLEFKFVKLLSSGTPNHPKPDTIGGGDGRFIHVKGGIFTTSAERDIGVQSVSATSPAGEGCNVTIDATISNNGPQPENFTVGVYYNHTAVDPDNFTTAGNWILIKEFNVTNMVPGSKSWLIQWNTTSVLGGFSEGYFYIMVNVTDPGIHMENNAKLSNIIFVTTEIFSDIIVTKLEAKTEFDFPLIRNETVDFSISVWYNGTKREETFNVELYFKDPNNEMVYPPQWSWSITLAAGHRATINATWDSTGYLKGNYTFIANASIPDEIEENLINNVLEQNVLVILPPVLQIDVTPYSKYTPPSATDLKAYYTVPSEEAILFDASGSYHPNEGAEIIEYTWEIMDNTLTVVDVITGQQTAINYNFTSGNWIISLTVRDNYNLTYTRFRTETISYTTSIGITAEEKSVTEEFPYIYLVTVVVIIIVVAVVVIYFLWTRKK